MSLKGAGGATLLGLAMAMTGVLFFPSLQDFFTRPALEIRGHTPAQSPGPYFQFGDVDTPGHIDGLAGAIDRSLSPGLHYVEWTKKYRGGHVRSVAHTQLVGPFQRLDAPRCSVSVLISQSFLDGGESADGSIAHLLQTLIAAELKGLDVWPLGRFIKVESLALRWVGWGQGQWRRAFTAFLLAKDDSIQESLSGHLRVAMRLRFSEGVIPLTIALLPWLENNQLHTKMFVDARLKLGNRLYQWVAKRLDGDRRVSTIVDLQLKKSLHLFLGKPPPLPLHGKTRLEFEFCEGRQITFHKGHIAVPLGLVLDDMPYMPPMETVPNSRTSATMETALALEVDVNGLNAVLHKLWSSGLLDTHLASSIVGAFNTQETVREYLNIRLGSAHFDLPPTLEFLADQDLGFELRAGVRLSIESAGTKIDASLFSQFRFALGALELRDNTMSEGTQALVKMQSLELSCEPEEGVYRPCFSDILGQVRANQGDLQKMILAQFQSLLNRIVKNRTIAAPGVPGHFRLEDVSFTVQEGILRASLHGKIGKSP